MDDDKIKFTIDCSWLAAALLFIFFVGSPDIADAIVFKLTGVKNW
jgi:hypothetical protein